MLKGKEKAAAVLSLLGEELSQKVLGFLPEDKAMEILNASETLTTPTRDTLMDVVAEFNTYMKQPPKTQTSPPAEEKPVAAGTPLDRIVHAKPEMLAQVLEKERPEISAYVLSHLPIEKIYEILGLLRDSREAVESRLVSIKDVPVAKEIEDNILNTIAERLA